MSDFTITEVQDEERFTTANGDFVSYTVAFEGNRGKGVAQHKRKASSPAPVVGETFDGEILHRNGRPELKRLYKPPAGSSNGSRGKTGDFRTPEQIMRSDAHGKAMHWCDVKVAAGEWSPLDWDAYLKMVDRFYEDIKAAS